MFRTLSAFVRKWRASRNGGSQLLELLSRVEWDAPLGARNHWLIEVVRWVRRGGLLDEGVDESVTRPQHVRLHYLLRTLDQQPEWKLNVARLLRATLRESDAVAMLCDTGMPTRSGFWGALVERVQDALIPPAPNTRNLSAIVTLMFADADRARGEKAATKAGAKAAKRARRGAARGVEEGVETGAGAGSRPGDEISWIDTIPAPLLDGLVALIRYGVQEDEHDREHESGSAFSHALLSAMHNLCYQIGSTGLSSSVRSRLTPVRIERLPFYRLGPAMQAVEAAQALREADNPRDVGLSHAAGMTALAATADTGTAMPVRADGTADAASDVASDAAIATGSTSSGPALMRLLQEVNVLRALLDECHRSIRELYAHLDANGVSVEVVFQVERMRERLVRFERLLDAWMTTDDPASQARLIADLVRATRARHSVGHLVRTNFALLARKMIESCAQTGGHYIAYDRREYGKMLWMAAGGGAVTAVTVYVKFFITGAHLQPMVEGFLAGVNYALSFVLMHFLHFTLATKQPAMTAPAIAQRLEDTGTPAGLDTFAADVVALMRTQAAAVLGNLVLVFPLCLGAQLLWAHFVGGNLISPQKAQATLHSFSLLGPTPIWAAMTGVLLWLSSLLAGWAENWFALHRIADVLFYNRRLRFVLGDGGAARIASFWRRNFSGIVSNLALGMMLGLVPSILTAFALPFEVRHVTLSTGSIAVALGVLGPSALHHAALWWAVAGTAAMAVLNVAVSFALAFQMALRSRTSLPVDQREIYRSIGRRVLAHPFELLFPAADAKVQATTADAHSDSSRHDTAHRQKPAPSREPF